MLDANVVAVFYKNGELLPIEFVHYENMHFRPFRLLWPWPLRHDLHIWTWPVSFKDIPDLRKWTSYV